MHPRQRAALALVAKETLVPFFLAGAGAVVAALLERGADAGAANKEGLTALRMAAGCGHAAAVAALLEGGAEVASTQRNGSSALRSAAEEGHTETVAALLAAGADGHRRAGARLLQHGAEGLLELGELSIVG